MERNKPAMWELLQSWDIALFRLINDTWSSAWLDGILSFLADFRLMKWPLMLAVLITLIWGGFRARLFLFLMLLALVIGDGGINWTIKKSVNRPRPYQSLEDVRRVKREGFSYRVERVSAEPYEKGRSMTSGHVCNNVALAFLATLLFAPWGRWVWVWAGLIAYSRIYTADHYPSDVAVSIVVALIYTTGICCVVQFLWQQWAPRLFPKTYAQHPRLYARSV
jgi:undecaprenyl-diphosphatase